jgi:hypothetical protein
MESTDEVPDGEKLWLDRDVATWLHLEADRHFAGNVELCMNEMLRIVMQMSLHPDDPWIDVIQHQNARARGRREQALQAPKPPPAIRLRSRNPSD